MSKYTEVLHDLLMNEETNTLINKALSSYPLYTPTNENLYYLIPTREELNKKILNHYRWHEIGSETVGRFLFNLEMTMNEIMPFYNQLYKSVDIMNGIDDIFGNVDIKESFEQLTEGNSSNNSNENVTGNTSGSTSSNTESTTTSNVTSENTTDTDMTTSGRTANSKTPQSQLQAKTLDSITAASEMGWHEDTNSSNSSSSDESNSTTTSTGTATGTNTIENSQETTSNSTNSSTGKTTHTLTKKGNQGVNTYAHDMLEFRELFMNIEQRIINDPELAKCFMLVW